MRKFLAAGVCLGVVFLGALGATSALGADWQMFSQTETATTFIDKQSVKKVAGPKAQVSIMIKYAQASTVLGVVRNVEIVNYTVNCGDFTSTANRVTFLMDSKTVKVEGPYNVPAPSQSMLESGKGTAGAFRSACSSAGNS